MSWNRATTAPAGYGVFGGSASLAPGQSSQLVRAEFDSPQVWTVSLQCSGPVEVRITEGNGQSAIGRTQVIAGPTFLQVTAATLEVNATNKGAASATISASCAPGNGPPSAPQNALVEFNSTLAPATATAFAATSANTRLVHNNTGGVLTVSIPAGGPDVYRLANQATLTLSYGGSFTLLSPGGGAVSVVGLFP